MASLTTDHGSIKRWVEERGGTPSKVKGTDSLVRIKFEQNEDDLEEISWDDFFAIFEEANLAFLHEEEKDNRFFKFVQR